MPCDPPALAVSWHPVERQAARSWYRGARCQRGTREKGLGGVPRLALGTTDPLVQVPPLTTGPAIGRPPTAMAADRRTPGLSVRGACGELLQRWDVRWASPRFTCHTTVKHLMKGFLASTGACPDEVGVDPSALAARRAEARWVWRAEAGDRDAPDNRTGLRAPVGRVPPTDPAQGREIGPWALLLQPRPSGARPAA